MTLQQQIGAALDAVATFAGLHDHGISTPTGLGADIVTRLDGDIETASHIAAVLIRAAPGRGWWSEGFKVALEALAADLDLPVPEWPRLPGPASPAGVPPGHRNCADPLPPSYLLSPETRERIAAGCRDIALVAAAQAELHTRYVSECRNAARAAVAVAAELRAAGVNHEQIPQRLEVDERYAQPAWDACIAHQAEKMFERAVCT